jgi:Cu-Zn family superoxide dismutase
MTGRLILAATLAVSGLVLAADMEHAHGPATMPAMHTSMWATVHEAVAVVHPLGDSGVSGTVRFVEKGSDMVITADLSGLAPNSKHAFHIHEFGDCSDPKGASAGGHYNPEGHRHGGPEAAEHHAGDLGNITADGSGKLHYEITVSDLTVAGMRNPIVGRSVIIHAKEDDLTSQPAGNAGDRIGCGVIGIAKPKGQ